MLKWIKIQFVFLFLLSCQAEMQTKLPTGYPNRSQSFDVLPGFIQPPKGYGEVPFYWWQGDTLTRERLLWQLNQLDNKSISSLQINYSHFDQGGLSYGLSNPSKPALFTNDWWSLFKWFANEAQKRGMSVSLSDYTLGIGQGFSMDEAIANIPDLNGAELKSFTKNLSGNGSLNVPENILTLTAFRLRSDSSLITDSRKDILPQVQNNILNYNFGKETCRIIGVYPEKLIPSYDPMNPQSGKAYNDYFFGKFEKALPKKDSGELNFFFSDELNFRVGGNLWNSAFAGEFKKRKGYNLVPYLDALYINIGDITPKIKLDYNDVIVALSEENFFKPVFQWHQDRGMIFGCDHGGRGRDVAEFGDYFRTQRWNQGPGSDQPNLSKDIIKAKVASSIAHLYDRPRVWLEGFHSSGWSTSSSDLSDAIFANYVAGYNLMSFHGLYYSTQGGWWEWAPPCNHFRMPYWKQIAPLMSCIERLSFLLSQGVHNCDVAIMYPIEPVVAGMDGNNSVEIAFGTGEKLYNQGIDFDFIDFESLARSEIKNQEINVSGEKYKVLIVPSMKAIRYASLKKIEEFKNAGGIVVCIGDTPQATEKNGINDIETSTIVAKLFSESENLIRCNNADDVPLAISGKYKSNFKILSEINERPYVMHRTIGKREVFALYNFPSGSKCFFNAKGSVELWNPYNGAVSSLSEFANETAEGTEISLPLTNKEIQLIVFDPDNKECASVQKENKIIRQISIDNNWEFELKPSLDNQWGDFQLPAKNELLGAQVRQLHFKEDANSQVEKLTIDETWQQVTCAFGTQFLKLGPLQNLPSDDEIRSLYSSNERTATVSGNKYFWKNYAFSWKQGVEGDYGHQGYHGLKGKMYDNFIRLGTLGEIKHSKIREPEAEGNFYMMSTSVIAPYDGTFDLLTGTTKPSILLVNNEKTDVNSSSVKLNKGSNKILLAYNQACETFIIFRKPGVPFPLKQQLSMCWYDDSAVLPFDCSSNINPAGIFAFESAPGLQSFTFEAYGKVKVWVDGVQITPTIEEKQASGLTSYKVMLKDAKPASSQVVLKIEYQQGYSGAGAIPNFISQQCEKGIINLGDWSEIDGLKAYSGGAWYRKSIQLDAQDIKQKLEIDLGDLVSSAELFVNGQSAGIRLSPPWKFDITKQVKEGENRIEVLIYNTLANNYIAIPTRYRGSIKSGIIGPVTINVIDR